MSSVAKLPAEVLKRLDTRLGVRSKVSYLFLYDLFTTLRYEWLDAPKSNKERPVQFSIDDIAEFYYKFYADKEIYCSHQFFFSRWRRFIRGIPKAGVFAVTNEGKLVLVLMKKTLADGEQEVVLGFPKGKRNFFDETLKDTGYREMLEETGIKLSSDGVKREIHQREDNLILYVESKVDSSLVDEDFSQEFETNGVRMIKANELDGEKYVPVVFEGREVEARLSKSVFNVFLMINDVNNKEFEDVRRICLIE